MKDFMEDKQDVDVEKVSFFSSFTNILTLWLKLILCMAIRDFYCAWNGFETATLSLSLLFKNQHIFVRPRFCDGHLSIFEMLFPSSF